MSEKKGITLSYLGGPLIIGILAALLQMIDQLLVSHTIISQLLPSGGAWLAFLCWSIYFLGGCNPKGGVKAFISYVVGIVLSILIFKIGGAIGGFWGVPIALVPMVAIGIVCEKWEWTNYVPALYVGAGAYFGIMSYIAPVVKGPYQGSFYAYMAVELFYCIFGLFWGFLTITLRGVYDRKFNS